MVQPSGPAPARILIVDDEVDISEMLAEILAARGYTVRTAADGEEGLRCLRQELPDVVILDVEMPHLTGPDMSYRMIVEDAGMERIPVVLVSGVVGLPQVAARVGTQYSLGKPASLSKLLELVERALREKIAPSPPTHPGAGAAGER